MNSCCSPFLDRSCSRVRVMNTIIMDTWFRQCRSRDARQYTPVKKSIKLVFRTLIVKRKKKYDRKTLITYRSKTTHWFRVAYVKIFET